MQHFQGRRRRESDRAQICLSFILSLSTRVSLSKYLQRYLPDKSAAQLQSTYLLRKMNSSVEKRNSFAMSKTITVHYPGTLFARHICVTLTRKHSWSYSVFKDCMKPSMKYEIVVFKQCCAWCAKTKWVYCFLI